MESIFILILCGFGYNGDCRGRVLLINESRVGMVYPNCVGDVIHFWLISSLLGHYLGRHFQYRCRLNRHFPHHLYLYFPLPRHP